MMVHDLAGIAITGASGFIGSSLVARLRAAGIKNIIELGRQDGLWFEKSYSERGWLNVLERADIIFHFGSNTDLEWAENNPEMSLAQAIDPIRNLISAAKKIKKKVKVIYASSATIYGAGTIGLIDESVIPNPCTIYDLHKYYVENYLNLASMDDNFRAISLRLSNVYGPSLVGNKNINRGILNQMIVSALNGDSLKLYVGKDMRRDYLYIDDLIDALCQCINTPVFKVGIYNLSSGKSLPMERAISSIIRAVGSIAGINVAIEKIPLPNGLNKIHYRNYYADIEKIQKTFSWRPKTAFEDGVSKTVNFHMTLGAQI